METTVTGGLVERRRSLPPVPRPAPARRAAPPPVGRVAPAAGDRADGGQAFVARLRTAARDFAGAAGAESAVVREAVPPARHRRARCRLVLRHAGGTETDLVFLGPVDRPAAAGPAFPEAIQRWLAGGQDRDGAWLVSDDGAPDGVAIDVTAWLATR